MWSINEISPVCVTDKDIYSPKYMKFIWKKGFKCQMHRTNRYRRLFWFFEWNKKVVSTWPTQQYMYSWHNSHVFKVELYVYLSMLFSFWGAGEGRGESNGGGQGGTGTKKYLIRI